MLREHKAVFGTRPDEDSDYRDQEPDKEEDAPAPGDEAFGRHQSLDQDHRPEAKQ